MKTIIAMTIILSGFLTTNQALACAGAGLSKASLIEIIEEAESAISKDEALANLTIKKVFWSKIQPSSGAEGDCEAIELTGKATVSTRNSEGKFCFFKSDVEIFKSENLGNFSKIELTKDFCQF